MCETARGRAPKGCLRHVQGLVVYKPKELVKSVIIQDSSLIFGCTWWRILSQIFKSFVRLRIAFKEALVSFKLIQQPVSIHRSRGMTSISARRWSKIAGAQKT